MPRLPVKKDEEVEVDKSDPTVSCDVVAIRAEPSALDVMMELLAKAVLPVPPLAMVLENEPDPIQFPPIEKQPVVIL